jgi:hypothetical protein
VSAEPDYARAVAFAREARTEASALKGRGGRRSGPVLVFASVLLAGLHGAAVVASLGAASDVPTARTREVDAMKLSEVLAIGAVSMASSAWAGGEVPEGWMVVADSQAQFSGAQGQDGWWYRFDRGDGTVAELMPYFGVGGTHLTLSAWNASRTPNTYCIQYGARMHANSPGACSAPAAGTLRPIREWRAPVALTCRIELTGTIASNTAALRIDLLIDGAKEFSQTATFGSNIAVGFQTERFLQDVAVRLDPVGDDCNADVIDGLLLRLLTPDCNANLVPDAVEIANGSADDHNHDGVPDSCQCAGDVVGNGVVDGADLAAVLTVWGTDGAIYPRADTNADGLVDGTDLAVVLGSWGSCP